ncbi:MAG: hypothetical protein RJA99_3216 [Pseudomonadota bacterium]|jgi:hypothetical protein
MGTAKMFQTARVAALPGVETTMVLYPQNIPIRTRKAAARMLAGGVAVGGWASKSLKIARIVAEHFGIALARVHTHSRYVEVPHDNKVREDVLRVFDVDSVQYMLTANESRHHFNPSLFKERRARQVSQLLAGESDSLGFVSRARFNEAKAIVVEYHRRAASTDHHNKRAADFMLGTEPITLTHIPKGF